jgi:hypothetical protein
MFMHKPYSLLPGLAQSILEATGKGRKLRGHFTARPSRLKIPGRCEGIASPSCSAGLGRSEGFHLCAPFCTTSRRRSRFVDGYSARRRGTLWEVILPNLACLTVCSPLLRRVGFLLFLTVQLVGCHMFGYAVALYLPSHVHVVAFWSCRGTKGPSQWAVHGVGLCTGLIWLWLLWRLVSKPSLAFCDRKVKQDEDDEDGEDGEWRRWVKTMKTKRRRRNTQGGAVFAEKVGSYSNDW